MGERSLMSPFAKSPFSAHSKLLLPTTLILPSRSWVTLVQVHNLLSDSLEIFEFLNGGFLEWIFKLFLDKTLQGTDS